MGSEADTDDGRRYLADWLWVEDGQLVIENSYEVAADASFEEAVEALEDQNAEYTPSPATDTKRSGIIRVVGMEGYYWLKFPEGGELAEAGAKEGNGHRKGSGEV